MYLLEFNVSRTNLDLGFRKLKKTDDGWYDGTLDVVVYEPGLYYINVDTLEVNLVGANDYQKFDNHLYFLICKSKLSLCSAILGFSIGRGAEIWKSHKNSLLN